jgi:DNA-directed RNA polymerase specialized sigma24 family protein
LNRARDFLLKGASGSARETLAPQVQSNLEMASDNGAPAAPSGRWILTGDAFERLLATLNPDRERAAVTYEQLRVRIIGLLRWWGAAAAEQLADETLDRVARKLLEGTVVPQVSLGAYVRGVARLVFYESSRERLEPLSGFEAAAISLEDGAAAGECLDRCLASWPAADRDLLLRYYGAGKAADVRRRMADELGISSTALRIRMHRLRARLERCVAECLK